MAEAPADQVLADATAFPLHFLERFVFVVNKVTESVNFQVESVTSTYGFTFRQYGLLLLLHIEGPQSQALLSQRTGLDRMTIVRTVDLFEARGFARREPDLSDRRKHRVVLTDTGTALLTRTLEKVNQAESEFTSVLSDHEQALLLSLLKRLLRLG